jgi:agmatinase
MPSSPFDYPQQPAEQFGGDLPVTRTWEESEAIILPIPFERTVSYGQGTANGPREILAASAQVELWDEEVGADVHPHGMFTAPALDLSAATLGEAMARIQTTAGALLDLGKFVVALGGEHSITPPLVAAVASRTPGLTVLQIDAHADLRDAYLGERNSHACAMRRALEHAPVVQVGIRNMSEEEAQALPGLNTTIFYDWNMREDPRWIDRAVDALSENVYITIDLDGLDPGLLPATGTPEPGGLSWREALALVRRAFERRRVVACDVVELCPIPGLHAADFAAARLVYKLLCYRFGLPTG